MSNGIGTSASRARAGSRSRTIWWRRLAQLTGLAILGQWAFYGIFRCPFIVPFVSCQNCPVVTCHGRIASLFWGFWLAMPVSAALFGRAFCGWACPGGMVHRVLGRYAPLKWRPKRRIFSGVAWGKYLALFIALYVWLAWGQHRVAIPIRVGDFFSSIGLTVAHAGPAWLIRTGVILGFLVLGLLLAGAWCRFACPTGGLLELLKPFSLFRVHKTSRCNDCDHCRRVCNLDTRPAETDCTNCCDCLSVCPSDAIRIGRSRG